MSDRDTTDHEHPTDDEIQERVDFARDLQRRTRHKSKLRAAIREKYGAGLHHSTCDEYCRRAREVARLDHERTRAEMRADLGEVLAGVMEVGRAGDIVSATREYARLYGLNLETPPVEVLCDQLGIGVEQFYAVVGAVTGRTLPGSPQTPRHDPEPPAV